MQKESLIHVADFYSGRADYPLRNIRAGMIVVAGSDKRYRGTGRCCLWMAVMNDRAFVSTQHELVDEVRNLVGIAALPQELVRDDIRGRLVALCRDTLGDQNAYYLYDGVKLYCDEHTYIRIADEHVRKITHDTAADAIARLRSVDVPGDVDYLMADDAAFAYYVEDRPVAFAATHPMGDMSAGIGNIMVGTLESYRRRGYGKAVVSATTGELLRQGSVTVWGAYADNIPAIKTASSVGFQRYCRVFEVRFHSHR